MSKSISHPSDWSYGESNTGMSHNDSSHDTPEPPVYVAPDVANREEKAVNRSKILVFFVLLIAVCGAATATYILMEEEQYNDFAVSFAGLASEVSTVSRQRLDQIFSALDAFSLFISSEVEQDASSSWPFVTIADYSKKSEKISELFGFKRPALILSSLVQEDEKENWTSFILETAPGWYQQSLENEGNKYTVDDLMNITIPFVHQYDFTEGITQIPTQTPGAVLPIWHRYPLEPGNVGLLTTSFDFFFVQAIADLFELSNLTHRPSLGFTSAFNDTEGATYGQWVVDSQIVQPIIENGKMVGMVWFRLPWSEFFDNLNVDGLFGMVAVIRTSCEISFDQEAPPVNVLSYSIDASGATLLGQYDAHDTQYDAHVVSQVIVDVDLDEDQLPEGICLQKLTLDLYPTKELEATFHTSKPVSYTSVVVAIFAFTSLVFLLYDYFVGRRQRKFMDRIMRQDQIVSNVFPTAIRDRLYQSGQAQKGSNQYGLLDPLGGGLGGGGVPLADLFPETTIMFADIAGFTAWASAREPAQVFILLETIFGGFDKKAFKHSVFKVETVGDCYVAVAGLPEPDKGHALSVCRFARDCIKTMNETTLKLEVLLGPDTSDLELRVGIHSGQVTAGVLRGERSRFQLFGDTMNTAARMESTSQRNRIQVSQVTADLLVSAGLSAWITPRKCKIF
eukprot:scaffold12306_cov109-Cylindrotheca_fusiformis.AAC.1